MKQSFDLTSGRIWKRRTRNEVVVDGAAYSTTGCASLKLVADLVLPTMRTGLHGNGSWLEKARLVAIRLMDFQRDLIAQIRPTLSQDLDCEGC